MNLIFTSATISSINLFAFSYLSLGPSMKTFLTSVLGIGAFAIWNNHNNLTII
jgi:hypothetical protein